MSNKLHKGVASFVASTTILWSIGASLITGLVTPAIASAEAGDIIKGPTSGTVYVILSDGESICKLTSPDHYVMWSKFRSKGLKMWEDIMTVETSTYTDKGVCGLRTGSLVRTTGNPEVFVIQPGTTKRGFDAMATFTGLGYTSAGVFYVTDEVIGAYSTGNKLTSATMSAEIREGQLTKYADSKTVYYTAKEGEALVKKEIVNEEAFFSNFGGVWKAVVTIPSTETYTTSASQITGPDTSINRPVAVTTTVTPPGGTVAISLASDTPSGTLAPTLSYGNVFTKLNVSAGTDTTISSIKVFRDGLGARENFASVYIYVDGVKYTTARTFNSDNEALFSFGSGLMLKAGTPRSLAIVGDMAAITATGQHKLGIKAAGDITSNGTVSGTFPIMGNFVSTSTTRVGEMTVTSGTVSDTDIFVGEQQQELSRFSFTAGSAEKIRLNSIRFRNTGSAKLSDYINFALYKSGTKIEGTEAVTSGEYVTLKNINLTFDKGEALTIKLYGDVVGGATSTIQFSIEEAADVSATGLSFGYGVTVDSTALPASPTADSTATWTEQKSSGTAITIGAGELTISATGPASYSIDRKKNDIVLANLSILAATGETINIKKMYGYISISGTAAETDIENIQLIQKTGGTQVIDATAADAGAVATQKSFYFANFDVKGATTWDVIADTNDAGTLANDTWKFIMTASSTAGAVGDTAATITPVDAQNSAGKAVTNIKPAAAISNAGTVTLLDTTLTVTNVPLANESAVANQKDIPMIMLQVIGGSGGDAKITSMVFEDTDTVNTALGSNHLTNFSLYEADASGKTLATLETGKTATTGTANFAFTFSSLNSGKGLVVKKDETKYVVVKTDFSGAITTQLASISLSADFIGAEKMSDTDTSTILASAIVGDGTAIAGRSVTATASGRLVVSEDDSNDTNAASTQVLAGTKGAKTLYLKFNADYENVDLKTLILDLVNTSANDSVESVYLTDGGSFTLPGTYVQSSSEVTFGNGQTTFMTFDKNVDKVLRVVTDVRPIGTGPNSTADSGDKIAWYVDAETAADTNDSIVATGVSSNATLAYKTDNTATLNKIFFGSTTTDTNQANNDITSNTLHVRRSLITDITALQLETSAPVNGLTLPLSDGTGIEIFRFKITAAVDTGGNENAAIDLTDLELTTSATNVTLSDVQIYRTDASNIVVNASSVGTSNITFNSTNTSALSSLPNIASGTSAIFVVTATIADSSAGESVQVSITNLGTVGTESTVNLSAGDIVWSDNDDSTDNVTTSFVSWPGITINKVLGQTRVKPAT